MTVHRAGRRTSPRLGRARPRGHGAQTAANKLSPVSQCRSTSASISRAVGRERLEALPPIRARQRRSGSGGGRRDSESRRTSPCPSSPIARQLRGTSIRVVCAAMTAVRNIGIFSAPQRRWRRCPHALLGDKPVLVSSGGQFRVSQPAGQTRWSAAVVAARTPRASGAILTSPRLWAAAQRSARRSSLTRVELAIDQLIHEYDTWVHLELEASALRAIEALTIDMRGTRSGFA